MEAASSIIIDQTNVKHDVGVFSSPANVLIHTGNIANWNSLKSRKAQVPAIELYQSLQTTIKNWLNGSQPDEPGNNCFNSQDFESNEERPLVKITAKILMHQFKSEHIKEAVCSTLEALNVLYFDTVILALPPIDENLSFNDILPPYWMAMERLSNEGIAKSISSCDLDRQRLETLVTFATIPPEINQVNLMSCCHMPQDLVAYSKEVNVLLHTHGDHQVMLGNEKAKNLIHTVDPSNELEWETNWVVRYAIVIKCRGVIRSKGYIASISSVKPQGS